MNILQSKIVPTTPGIYQFLAEDGSILYIGKAKNLKNRVKQYYQKEVGRGPWIEEMIRNATDLRMIETDSEIEAVILEAELINKLKPKYNIKSKDDKSFLIIKITKEAFPRISLERYKNIDSKDKTADYFGPYPSGDLLKKSLRYLRRIFPFRDCSTTKYKTCIRKGRPCLYFDINVCGGPCTNLSDQKSYNKNISYLKKFLKGGKKIILSTLDKEMNIASKKKEYEKAIVLRNKIMALNHLKNVAIGLKDEPFDANKLLFKRIECFDISNILNQYVVGSMVVFSAGKPDKDEYRKFKIQNNVPNSPPRLGGVRRGRKNDCNLPPLTPPNLGGELGASDLSRLEQVLRRRFQNDWPKPDLLIVDGGEAQLKIAKAVLVEFNLKIPTISISKGPKRDKNDFHYSDSDIAKYFVANKTLINIAISARDESHRFAIQYYRSLHLKDMITR